MQEGRTIAIIGASYAGLALANTLMSKSQAERNPDASFQDILLFEAMPGPLPPGTIFNTVTVPLAPTLYNRMGLKWLWSLDTTTVQEEELLTSLRERLQKSIRYGHVVEHARIKEGHLHLHVSVYKQKDSARGEGETKEIGPLDVVVAANGVLSDFRNIRNTTQFFVLGDARWVANHWWDFGYKRLRSGANRALQDGVELGELLLQDNIGWCDSRYDRFSAAKKQQANVKRRVLLIVLLVAFFAASYAKKGVVNEVM
jgi:hypothetical protein